MIYAFKVYNDNLIGWFHVVSILVGLFNIQII